MVAVVLVLAAAVLGYLLGRQDPREHVEEVSCLSTAWAISCELEDDWTIGFPARVTWTDVHGAWHENTRPECLPPTGRGLEGPVRITWVPVDVDGTSWRQVVAVACLD
ncbi:hypothetical protein JCM10369A_28420 [Nocardioides pyridinolyticus]